MEQQENGFNEYEDGMKYTKNIIEVKKLPVCQQTANHYPQS